MESPPFFVRRNDDDDIDIDDDIDDNYYSYRPQNRRWRYPDEPETMNRPPPAAEQQQQRQRRVAHRRSRSAPPSRNHHSDADSQYFPAVAAAAAAPAGRMGERKRQRQRQQQQQQYPRRERSWSRDHPTDVIQQRRRGRMQRRPSYSTTSSSASSPSPPRRRQRRESPERWNAPHQHQQQQQQQLHRYNDDYRGISRNEYEPQLHHNYYRHNNNNNNNNNSPPRAPPPAAAAAAARHRTSWEESSSRDRQPSERHRGRRRRHRRAPQQQQQQPSPAPPQRRMPQPSPPQQHLNHRRHDQMALPLAAAAVAMVAPPRAGVVSVDDDAPYLPPNYQQNQQPAASSPPPPREPTATARYQNNNNRHSDNHKQRPSSGEDSHDDTVGHFQGGPGTVIAGRYKVIQDLGIGTFGRVVECQDLRRRMISRQPSSNNHHHHHHHSSSRPYRGQQPPPSSSSTSWQDSSNHDQNRPDRVAIKIVRNVKRKKYYESALIEAGIVEDVNRRGGRGLSHCAILWESFTFDNHFCMVFESLGLSLYDFLKRHNYQPFPMVCIWDFAQQLLEALEFLHGFQLIHTDLKPENILLTSCCREVNYRGYRVPESTRIKVIDFGGATYDYEKKSSVVNTRQYRSPEVILGVGWSMPSDVWSAGCILAELYTGELLFATHDNPEHLALMERIIGPFPRWMLKRAAKQQQQQSPSQQLTHPSSFHLGRHRGSDVLSPESVSYVKKMVPLDAMIRHQDARFLHLLRRLLVMDPNERCTARECLRHHCL